MHTHFSALGVISTFLAVLIMGTAWRLASVRLMASDRPGLSRAGQAMAFQY